MWLYMRIEMLSMLCTLVSSKPGETVWVNVVKDSFDFSCPPGHHISRMVGVGSTNWKFECKPRAVNDECKYVQAVTTCPDKGVVAGIKKKGWHYSLKCCELKARSGSNCRTATKIDRRGKRYDYTIPHGTVIKGFINEKKGQFWEIIVCDFQICVADSMKFLKPVKMTPGPIKVVGIATTQGCEEGVEYVTSLERDATKTHSSSVEHSQEISFTFGLSIGVNYEADIFGLTFGFSFSETFTGGFSRSHSSSKGSSVSVTSGSAQSLKFKGPGAALIIAHTREYHGKAQSAVAEYSVTCENGEKYKESHKVSLEASTYSHTNYLMRLYDYSAKDCSSESERCLEQIKGGDAVDINKIISMFKTCIKILTNTTEVNYLIN